MSPNREKKLINNALIYAIGSFSSKFISFFMVVIYTRYLTQKQLGEYDLIITTISMLLPIITIQINDGMYRYILDSNNSNEREIIVNNTIIITTILLIVFSFIYYSISRIFSFENYVMIYLYSILSIISNLCMYIARAYQRNKIYAVSGIIQAFVLLVTTIIVLIISELGIKSLLFANIIGSIVVIFYINYRIKIISKFSLKSIDKKLAKKMIVYSTPLIPTGIGWWIMILSDRYLLSYYLGMDANGIYAVANKFPSLLMLINQLFYLAWQETAITEYDAVDRDNFYTKMFNRYMILQLSTSMLLIAFTKILFSVMVGSSFQNAIQYTPFLYFGAVFSAFSSFYGTGYQSTKNTRGSLTTTLLASCINIIINILLIPLIGIQAASISTFFSFLVMWILRLYGTKNYFSIKIDQFKAIILFLLNTIVVILFYADTFLLDILMVVITVIAFVLFNKNIISYALKKILKINLEK